MSDNRNCSCATGLAILENEMNNMKLRDQLSREAEGRNFDEFKRNMERWQEQQDKRLEKLEQNDDNFHRDATNKERTNFGIWITVIATIGATVVGAILTLLFDMFGK